MSRVTTPDLELLIGLCRYYCLADHSLPATLVLSERGAALAELGYRHFHPDKQPPELGLVRKLRGAWSDPRICGIPPRQRQLLLFVTGAALARLEADPRSMRALLRCALAISRRTWASSGWEPWEGVRPEVLPRRAVDVLPDTRGSSGDEPDANGDPLEVPPAHTIEGPAMAAGRLAEFAHVSQILDGLDHWEAVVQEHVGIAIGTFARTGRPDLEQLRGDAWPEPLPEPVRAAFLAGAA